jgi:hypothetical protein
MKAEVLIDDASFTASGRARPPKPNSSSARGPLIVAIHGGGFTSEYFDIPGLQLL